MSRQAPAIVQLSQKDRQLIRELTAAIGALGASSADSETGPPMLVENHPPDDLWGSGWRPYWGDEPQG